MLWVWLGLDKAKIGADLRLVMMPKCSPVRCTALTLRQPVPEKIEQYKNTFKGGSGVEPAKYPPKVKSENVFTTLEC